MATRGSAFARRSGAKTSSLVTDSPASKSSAACHISPATDEGAHRKRGRATLHDVGPTNGDNANATRASTRARREPQVFRPAKILKATATRKTAPSPPATPSPVTDAPCVKDDEDKQLPPDEHVLPFSALMSNLHGAGAGGIVGREQEQHTITQFLEDTVSQKRAGALYVSGRPGCGKTLSVRVAADAYRRKSKVVWLNGMSIVDSARDLLSEILRTLYPEALRSKMNAEGCLRKFLTADSSQRPTILVLDELDALLHSGCEQSTLAALFSWTQLPGSRLVLVGIANTCDLTHRFLPVLHARNCAPQLLAFTPYTEHHLLDILRHRLCHGRLLPATVADAGCGTPSEFSDASRPSSPASQASVDTVHSLSETLVKFDLAALDLCARRVAAESGDTRKAMEACREAAKHVVREAAARSRGAGARSPSPAQEDAKPLTVGVPVMAKTLSALLVTNHKVSDKRLRDLPLHQALLLISVVLGARSGRSAHSESELLSAYAGVCYKHSLTPLPSNQFGEMRGALCDVGVLKACAMGKGKKVYVLSVKDEVVQNSLEDLPVYGKILQDASRCSALGMC